MLATVVFSSCEKKYILIDAWYSSCVLCLPWFCSPLRPRSRCRRCRRDVSSSHEMLRSIGSVLSARAGRGPPTSHSRLHPQNGSVCTACCCCCLAAERGGPGDRCRTAESERLCREPRLGGRVSAVDLAAVADVGWLSDLKKSCRAAWKSYFLKVSCYFWKQMRHCYAVCPARCVWRLQQLGYSCYLSLYICLLKDSNVGDILVVATLIEQIQSFKFSLSQQKEMQVLLI